MICFLSFVIYAKKSNNLKIKTLKLYPSPPLSLKGQFPETGAGGEVILENTKRGLVWFPFSFHMFCSSRYPVIL